MHQLILTVCGVGVVVLVIGLSAGKGDAPWLPGTMLLVLWVILEIWWQTRGHRITPLPNDLSPKGIYSQFRHDALTIAREESGLISPPIQSPIWSLVVETGQGTTTGTLCTLSNGRTDLYLSSGNGFRHGERDEEVRKASSRLLELTNGLIAHLSRATDTPQPSAGEVIIYARTDTGTLRAQARQDELATGRHPLSPVYFASLSVLAEMRRCSAAQSAEANSPV